MQKISVRPSLLDRAISVVSPKMALQRIQSKAAFSYLQSAGYIVAGSNKRSMRGWSVDGGDPNQDTLGKLEGSRNSSRDLYMNTPIATAAVKRVKTNAIGPGLTLQARVDRIALGLSDEEADDWERTVEREFRMWAGSKDCDARRTQNFYELTALSFTSVILSGDCFILLPMFERGDSPYQLRIKVLEGDYCSNPNYQSDTKSVSGGIEVDENGAPYKYWFRNSFSLDVVPSWDSVLAYGTDSGRQNVIHPFTVERPGQRRGMPLLAPVIEPLKQLSRLTEAELTAAVINSFFTVFVKTTPLQGGLTPGYVPTESLLDTGTKPGDEKLYELGSGSVVELDQDQDITLADPKRPNGAFDPFFMAIVKQIGASIEVPFEELILHFSSSYSASRAALIEAWKFYICQRIWCSRNICQPIYEAWLEEAILIGRISAPGFFDDPLRRSAWSNALWQGPKQGQLDPLKETNAAIKRIKGRLSTHEDEYVGVYGVDWERAMDRLSRENKYLEEKDLDPTGVIEGDVDGNEDELKEEIENLQNETSSQTSADKGDENE